MLDFCLACLAAWRLASLLVKEDGPWAAFARLRYKAGLRTVVRKDEQGRLQPARVAQGTLAEGLTCIWCVSVWTGALVVLLGRLPCAVGRVLVRVLAASAGAILVQEGIERLRR